MKQTNKTNAIILERALDFQQFQNMLIFIFCVSAIVLGFMFNTPLQAHIGFKVAFVVLDILLFTLLFLKKGLVATNQNLYTATFLFGQLLHKKKVTFPENATLQISNGKLGTNYAYTYKRLDIHFGWEPDVNVSNACYFLSYYQEIPKKRGDILWLLQPEKVKSAATFILENTTMLSIEQA